MTTYKKKIVGHVALSILLSVLIPLFSAPVSAEITPDSFTMGPFVGGYFFDKTEDIKDGTVIGVRLGYMLTPRVGFEASLDYPQSKFNLNGNSKNVSLYHIDTLYHFQPDTRLVPFVKGGIGLFSVKDEWNSVTGNLGVGVKYFLTQNMVLRGDFVDILALHATNGRTRFANFEATVAMEYVWEKGKKVSSLPPPVPVPEVKPEPVPMPVPVPMPEVKPEPVPAPAPVPVPEVKPEPVPLSVVPKMGTFRLDVKFENNKAVILQESEKNIAALADFMKKHSDAKLELEGHTDTTGDPAYNLQLSQTRADNVRKALISLGILPERIYAKGLGSSQPTADNATLVGRRENRRVVATLTAPEKG